MNILITGANGFLGLALSQRLLGTIGPRNQGNIWPDMGQLIVDRLTLVDIRFDAKKFSDDERVTYITADLAEPNALLRTLCEEVDLVLHLASITSGQAEHDFERGQQVNLHGTLNLFNALRLQQHCPRVVFTSSVAVYGSSAKEQIDDDTLLRPALSYGSHKQIGEILLSDFSHRGWIDGIALRVPSIVARPLLTTSALSVFNSDIIRRLSAGEHYTCPISEKASLWLMSVHCCIDNLLHAGQLTTDWSVVRRAFALPVLYTTVTGLVDALAGIFGATIYEKIHYRVEPHLERTMGSFRLR